MQQSAKSPEPASFSYWERTAFLHQADVAIIGSGIVGLTAAIHLKEELPALNVLLVERGVLPAGASTRNAGFACIGSMTELIEDMKSVSQQQVFELVARRWKGLCRLRELLGAEQIKYNPCGNYELFRANDEEIFTSCCEQMNDFNGLLKSITGLENCFSVQDKAIADFGFGQTEHLILNRAEGQLHAGKMMAALLLLAQQKGVRILNATEIEQMEEKEKKVLLHCGQGYTLSAAKVLVATNGFARQLLPELPLQPARNQVMITRPLLHLKAKACFHYDRGFIYFRNIGDRLLLGGARNIDPLTEATTELGTTLPIRSALISFAKEVILPKQALPVDYWWSGILGVGQQKKPIIGRYSERIYTAVRMGGMGVAIGSLVGQEGAAAVLAEPPVGETQYVE